MKDLGSKVAVITGAGSGIGREIAVAMAKEGCHVALCDISQEGLEDTRSRLGSTGANVSTHQVDVSDEARMQTLAEEIINVHKHVHILINNAGVASGVRFDEQSTEDFERIIRINLFGVVYGCKYFLPLLKKEKEAHIVNICSIVGLMGNPMLGAYSTSKFAVRGFSESLWHELADENIGLTIVYPGFTKTGIFDNAALSDKLKKQRYYDIYKEKFTIKGNPPDRVARRVVYGIKKNKRAVVAGLDTFMLGLLLRFWPKKALNVMHNIYQTGIKQRTQ